MSYSIPSYFPPPEPSPLTGVLNAFAGFAIGCVSQAVIERTGRLALTALDYVIPEPGPIKRAIQELSPAIFTFTDAKVIRDFLISDCSSAFGEGYLLGMKCRALTLDLPYRDFFVLSFSSALALSGKIIEALEYPLPVTVSERLGSSVEGIISIVAIRALYLATRR